MTNENELCECGHTRREHFDDKLQQEGHNITGCGESYCSCKKFVPKNQSNNQQLKKKDMLGNPEGRTAPDRKTESEIECCDELYSRPDDTITGSVPNQDEAILKEVRMSDEELREYIKKEFVNVGFIEVKQWENFIDYLDILIKDRCRKAISLTREAERKSQKEKILELVKEIKAEIKEVEKHNTNNAKQSIRVYNMLLMRLGQLFPEDLKNKIEGEKR